jgi:hypothetical protein
LKTRPVNTATLIAAAGLWAAGFWSVETSAQAQPAAKPARPQPVFEVDSNWPKMPARFREPFVSGIQIDAQDNAWLTTRPARAQADAQKTVGFIYTGYGKGIAVIDRKAMEYIGMIEAPRLDVPGNQIAMDSNGNLYVTGVNTSGKANAERLIYKGMSAANPQ